MTQDIRSSYKLIKNSIVAFAAKYVPVYEKGQSPPLYPPIIGTGFVVREDGLIATNAHVVRAFRKAPKPPDVKDQFPVTALLFRLTDRGLLEMPLEIVGALIISEFNAAKAYYGPKEGPDLAFVQVRVRGLPVVTIDHSTVIDEGMQVATAGFPMGTEALLAPGWLHQITPTLQQGIVSAVLPFACNTPHAFSINIMVQGGASGSPVFLPTTGNVVGVLYAGLHDFAETLNSKDICRVPTNISYVVPLHYMRHVLPQLQKMPELKLPDGTPTIDEMIATSEIKSGLDLGSNRFFLKEVSAKTETERIRNLALVPRIKGPLAP